MKKRQNLLFITLLTSCLIACQSNGLTMSEEEFLRANAQNKDYNIQASSFVSSYVLNDPSYSFDELKGLAKTTGSYIYSTVSDEEGNFLYAPRANTEKAFKLSRVDAIEPLAISSNRQIYIDNTENILYDAIGNSVPLGGTIDTTNIKEYVIIIAGDTALYQAMTGEEKGSELHIFELAYISTIDTTLSTILYKEIKAGFSEGIEEYLIPQTPLLSYANNIAKIYFPYDTAVAFLENGTYQVNNQIYYYDENVSFSHVSKKDIERDIEIDTKAVLGNPIFTIYFENDTSILYSREEINLISNDFDYIDNNVRYKIRIYTNKNKASSYEEVNKFPKFKFLNIAYSKDGNKCAVLCQQINKDKSLSNQYSTIAFDNNYKYGKFASELGIFSGEEEYIQFGEEYYSFKNKDYDLLMYHHNDFAVLKVKDEERIDHKFLAVNSEKKDLKIFATNIGSLSANNHIIFYSTGEKPNLQFNVLDTKKMQSTVIRNSDNKQIASMEYGLYWEIDEQGKTLKDFMGNVIYQSNNVSTAYFYEPIVSPEYNIDNHSYRFYSFYGSEKYSQTTEGVTFNSLIYLTNQTK